jgi:hypothetical protein
MLLTQRLTPGDAAESEASLRSGHLGVMCHLRHKERLACHPDLSFMRITLCAKCAVPCCDVVYCRLAYGAGATESSLMTVGAA